MSMSIRFFSLWIIFAVALYASIGKVSILKGEAFVVRSSQILPLQTGSKVEEKDTVSTGKNGQIQLIFEDKTVITLGNSSTFKIEEYFNQEQKPKAKFSFAKGAFKTITGKIGKRSPESFTLETKTATIGIRGTIIRGNIGDNLDKIMCEKGAIGVRSRITGKEVLVSMGRIITLPHNAPPLPVRDVQPSDLAELSLNGDMTPPDTVPSTTSNPSDNPPPPPPPLSSPLNPPLQNFTPEVANTALETSFETVRQDTVTEEILTQECPSGTAGTYPDCVTLTCPSGTTGTYPDCVALTCPSGTAGTYPDCVALTCPSGTAGTYPDCVALTCPSGTTGTYPDCVAIYVPPTLYNVNRNDTLSGSMVHSFEDIGAFFGTGTGSYTLVQNTLSTQIDGNNLYFYDVSNTPISSPYEFRAVEWSVELPNVQAGTSYTGYTNVATIPMAFTSPDGSITIADPALATLYSDNMQQFFVIHYGSPTIVSPYEKYFDYGEWFGTITPYTSLATLFPNREVAIYRSPVDSGNVITVNYGNNHFLGVNMEEGQNNHFSIGVGRIEDHSNQVALVGEDLSGYYNFANLEVSTGISGYIYGDKAQGFGGSSLVQNSAGTSYNIGGMGAYRDTTITTSDLTGNLAFSGYANALKSDSSVSSPTAPNFTFVINRDTGILGASSINLTADNLGTITFQDGTGSKSAYINDDYFATIGTASGTGYLVALDTNPTANDDYVSWGYWGYIDNVATPTLTIVPSTWVAGSDNNASTYVDSLIALGTTASYTYNGKVLGHVNVIGNNSVYPIDSTSNNVQLIFNFGGGANSLDATSFIDFTANAQNWHLNPASVAVSAGKFTTSLSGTGGAESAAGFMSGQFYGNQAQSVGGTFNATTATEKVIGVFKGVR